jgi:hypothetical protein
LTTFLFFDESGNFDFSPGGTRFVVFGALTTRNPGPLLRPLSDRRYELIAGGIEIEAFHATEDKQVVRDRVFEIIKGVRGVEFDAVIVEKAKVDPALYDVSKFYPTFSQPLLTAIFNRHQDAGERVVIITDRLPLKRTKNAVEKAFKTFIRQNFSDRLFTILHHSSLSHACLQAADYCTWAVCRKWRDNELRPYAEIGHLVKTEVDVLEGLTQRYY